MDPLQTRLRELARHLDLEAPLREEVLRELASHLEERVRELRAEGLSEEQAVARAVEELGPPRALGRAFSAVHCKASWEETGLAVLPHLLVAVLFAFHVWRLGPWPLLFLVGAAVVSARAWTRGRPRWVYPWLGYCLVPLVVGWFGAFFAVVGGVWNALAGRPQVHPVWILLGLSVYLTGGVVLVAGLWRRLVERDWLYASITLMPLPFLAVWAFSLEARGGWGALATPAMVEMDRVTALLFLALAGVTGVVYRLSTRFRKLACLVCATPLLLGMGMAGYGEDPASLGVLAFLLLSVGLILMPALIRPHPPRP